MIRNARSVFALFTMMIFIFPVVGYSGPSEPGVETTGLGDPGHFQVDDLDHIDERKLPDSAAAGKDFGEKKRDPFGDDFFVPEPKLFPDPPPEPDDGKPIPETNPDDWGEGEVILGSDPEVNERAKKIGKRLAEADKRRKEREEKERKRKEEIEKKIKELKEKLREQGLDKKGWKVKYDGEGEPYVEHDSNPDDWGVGEAIL